MKSPSQRCDRCLRDVLVPLAAEHHLTVVDGGTDAGIMKMMGEARSAARHSFPLIGVAPSGLVSLPGTPSAHPRWSDARIQSHTVLANYG